MSLDRLSLLIGCIAGILIGLFIAYFLVIYGIDSIGHAFTIQNMNITIDINETAIVEEARKQMYIEALP